VEELGGVAPAGAQLKAVQTGGPSGGCIPATLFNMPIDYDSPVTIGAIMGSDGMVVMHDQTNMVELDQFYMQWYGRIVRQMHSLPRRYGRDAPVVNQDRAAASRVLPVSHCAEPH